MQFVETKNRLAKTLIPLQLLCLATLKLLDIIAYSACFI